MIKKETIKILIETSGMDPIYEASVKEIAL
jgi:hypothetical protein